MKTQLKNLIELFVTKILDTQTYHLNLFFEDDWTNKYHLISYGHDIEASWLIHEAALVLGDETVLKQIEPVIVRIARAADEGLNADGSMTYERFSDKGETDRELHWWVQALEFIPALRRRGSIVDRTPLLAVYQRQAD